MKYIIPFLIVISFNSFSQNKPSDPLAHTYSIVARDAETGEMAVAVQSHWFSVGTAVSWGEAGVGVVATQSFTNKSFGPRGLAMMKSGLSPQQAMDSLINNDEGEAFRQVAILNSEGQVASHTGAKCIDEAGHINGDNFSVQANMMLNKSVVPAMENAWKSNKDLRLAERMVEVLKAAQAEGGDIRGKQSAALLIVKGEASEEPWNDKVLDLRVDDHENPISELDRLVKVFRAYEHMNQGDLYVEKGAMQEAMNEYNAAMEMFPRNLEMQYWTAITLANDGKMDRAVKMLQKIYQEDANWRELTKRLPKVGLLEVEEKDLIRLTH
ncbi:DUF1028 domain-containing protein [Marivirga salinae]|uniref:DUF1028 domain-containing protein n=1 Tax=Marivirga salinarum TaxID=3059078 RepID=A0AA51NAQ9_9BACT|nr:DUF1028 domain-containing protein [Marivirga sp. BDSF4-3]WMN11683.1 DUF1028 domain-containing protein [Marivirga sp. BDSF4-3]